MATQKSPLGMAQKVSELMRMPQSLCNQCGWSCRIVTFKGGLSYSEMSRLAKSDEATPQVQQIREFLSMFIPYNSQDEVRNIAPVFVERVRAQAVAKGENPDNVTFYKCQNLLSDSRCGVHEDRPEGCRQYPIVHPNTIFHPGCGFEEQSKQNWAQIEHILNELGLDQFGNQKIAESK